MIIDLNTNRKLYIYFFLSLIKFNEYIHFYIAPGWFNSFIYPWYLLKLATIQSYSLFSLSHAMTYQIYIDVLNTMDTY